MFRCLEYDAISGGAVLLAQRTICHLVEVAAAAWRLLEVFS